MNALKNKLICPFCDSRNVLFKNEQGYCFGCHKEFDKRDAKPIQIEEHIQLPPSLQKIAKARNGSIVKMKACPLCGSLSINYTRNGYYNCTHCKQKSKKEELILYGEKPVLKINKKREVIQ